jgi:hypothetical protein
MKFVGSAWKLSPSDLTFLASECPRCLWMKIAGGHPRPRAPFPRIFSVLDAETKKFFAGKRTEKIAVELPPGRVVLGDRWVRSAPIHVPGHHMPVFIAGRFDSAIRFDDSTYGVVDFKTTNPKDGHIPIYSRQVHSYAFALEHPAPGSLSLTPVTRLGLFVVEPVAMIAVKRGVAYKGVPHWVEIERDDIAFMAFLGEVLDVLERPSPPEPNPRCSFCTYLLDGVLAHLATGARCENAEAPGGPFVQGRIPVSGR